MFSLRIRAGDDRQAIAKQCGTSVEMLERSYSFAIEDLEDEGPSRRRRSGCAPGSWLSPVGVVNSGSREGHARADPESCHAARTSATLGRSSSQPESCCTRAARIATGARQIREIPASADVAQLVEHFTRNEGVPGSSPGVGLENALEIRGFSLPELRACLGRGHKTDTSGDTVASRAARICSSARRWSAPSCSSNRWA